MTTATTAPPALEDVLANRRWVRRGFPFPHVVAQNVFTPEFYGLLDAEFRRIEREQPEAFQRNMAGYDATGAMLDHHRDGPLGIFVSRAWHDLLAGVGGIDDPTGDMTASLHHHEPGSADGWPHQDLNPGWFGEPAGPDEVRLPYDGPPERRVAYHHGTRAEGVPARETVRAVSALFYLANPPWEPGDGGETGLYTVGGQSRPTLTVPPVNNSLVLFECSPFSWHGFLSNRVKPRNSVVMWIHRPKDEVVRRWGDDSIRYWSTP
ncbi:2OG-Fe(II) oxygenase [Jatrophihabitans fulvus]